MSTILIAEFDVIHQSARGQAMQIPSVPPLAGQVVTFTTSTQSAAFNASTTFIRIKAVDACHLEFGVNPTATTSSVIKMDAGETEYFGVTPGQKVAAINA